MDAQSQPARRGGVRPGAGRKPGAVGLRQRLIDGYVAALGGDVGPIVLQDVERAADLMLLARGMRAKALRGEVSIGDVTRLEVQAGRAVKNLNLPPPGKTVAPAPSLQDYIARLEAEKGGP